ncbi:PEP/pyruvate-binding domain-containing protein [Kitasatospora sp. SUK 42]|uniref:PEP/pyruvate-binding domain-containing protein n=1 Tax=Kitasatospora sp. SUK 42 TaxID=1588882 RepID=UPI0018CBC281|nr:PEP/pyruvate-binding domain-containing protein [Kitasatospora sp. SUK 42]MBV2154744.1 PEP/pyruvate-binding domain-containing protein [Kitasatospora sp. SUK 42]
MNGAVRWSEEFAALPATAIGGKAKGLGTLIAAGLPVPEAFCVTVEAHRAALAGAGQDVDGEIRRALAVLRERGADSFAVRSSYLSEDTAEALSPGVYLSEVGLGEDEEVLAAVRRVWRSAGSAAAVDYRRTMGLAGGADAMAVIVQRAVPARAGGVVYTLPPGGDPATVLVEYAAGAPGNVIDNLAPPLRSVLGKREQSVPEVGDGPVSGAQLRTLAGWAARLERELDGPLDLEWLLDGAGELQLLQARRLPYPVVAAEPPYVAPAAGTALRSDKLAPFRLRGRVELNTIEADLVLPSAFAAYRDSGAVPEECREVFARYAARGPVSVRSVYWSALGSGDMLPQSALLTSVADCVAHLERYWRYVLEHGKADYSAEVALLVANWTDLRASVIATAGAGGPVEIGALFGQLEGLETCAHDRYTVALPELRTERADVPHKPLAVTVPRRPPQPLPEELRDRRVLDEEEVREAAAMTARLAERLGPVRVELLVLNGASAAAERVVAWQVTELRETAGLRYFHLRGAGAGGGTGGAGREAVASGRLTVLGAPEDVGALDGGGRRVVAVDFERFDLRDPQLATAIARALRAAGHPVLLKGSILSHFAALLREYGVAVYPVNSVPAGLGDGDRVDVLPD